MNTHCGQSVSKTIAGFIVKGCLDMIKKSWLIFVVAFVFLVVFLIMISP
jgi:hypothetical protein